MGQGFVCQGFYVGRYVPSKYANNYLAPAATIQQRARKRSGDEVIETT